MGFVVFTHQIATAREATVVELSTLYRIPDERATPWLSLAGGSSVMVELHWNRFYLVRTKSGVEGWIPQTDVFYKDGTQ
jgi:hypothetical protein